MSNNSKKRRPSEQQIKYLSYQKNDKTWREFYTELYGDCLWMSASNYKGEWLDKKMNEFIG